MEWTQLLNQAIDYLEEHLTGEISGTEAASHVGLSAFHFQRAFSLMTGLTVSEYLRSRRLSLAGPDSNTAMRRRKASPKPSSAFTGRLLPGRELPEPCSSPFHALRLKSLWKVELPWNTGLRKSPQS